MTFIHLQNISKENEPNSFIQYCLKNLVLKLGDFIYIQNEENSPKTILHINKIYLTEA